MSLYNRLVPATEGAGVEATEINLVCESTWLGEAVVELAQDIYKVMEASDIADIVGEYQVIHEGAEVEAVLEAITTGGFAKIKAAFQKFWNKIKSFFAEIKKQIKALFLKGEKFVKEFETELKAKKAKGYKYMSHKYSFDSGMSECTKAFDAVMKRIEGMLQAEPGKSGDMNDSDKLKSLIVKAGEARDDYKSDERYEETVIKNLKSGVESIAELKTELGKSFRSGNEASDREELEDFEGSSVSAMCDFIKQSAKKISEIEKKESKFDSTMSAIIKKIDNLSTKKETTDVQYKYASMLSTYLTTLLNIGKAPLDVEVTAIKEIAGSYESILKGYVRFKPAKESAVPTTENATLFDAIYSTIC